MPRPALTEPLPLPLPEVMHKLTVNLVLTNQLSGWPFAGGVVPQGLCICLAAHHKMRGRKKHTEKASLLWPFPCSVCTLAASWQPEKQVDRHSIGL